MKSTGIVRKIDELGRIVIPKEICRTLYIEKEDPIEFSVDGENIILRKYHPVCALCSSVGELIDYKEKMICSACLKDIKENY